VPGRTIARRHGTRSARLPRPGRAVGPGSRSPVGVVSGRFAPVVRELNRAKDRHELTQILLPLNRPLDGKRYDHVWVGLPHSRPVGGERMATVRRGMADDAGSGSPFAFLADHEAGERVEVVGLEPVRIGAEVVCDGFPRRLPAPYLRI